MLNIITVERAARLKKEMDAASKVFKKDPSISNAGNWTAALNAYTNFCVKTMDDLIKTVEGAGITENEIIANIDKYKTCKQCNSELLYLTSKDNYVASSDFLADFPGWCYNCLTEYCAEHECESCDYYNSGKCPFIEVKKLNQEA